MRWLNIVILIYLITIIIHGRYTFSCINACFLFVTFLFKYFLCRLYKILYDMSRKYYQCFDQNYYNVWSKNPNQFRQQLLVLNITHFYRLRQKGAQLRFCLDYKKKTYILNINIFTYKPILHLLIGFWSWSPSMCVVLSHNVGITCLFNFNCSVRHPKIEFGFQILLKNIQIFDNDV